MASLDDNLEDDVRPEYDLRKLQIAPGKRRNGKNPLIGNDSNKGNKLKLTPTDARQFIARMDAEMMPLFHKCVIPIYADHEGTPIQCGCGTLFRVAGYSFLVSASHVTDLARRRKKVQLYLSDGTQGAKGIALEGRLHSERNLDVSVWELTKEIVDELPTRKFLTLHSADRAGIRITRGWYYVHGYPNCWSGAQPEEQKTVVKAFTYGTVLYQGDTSTFQGYDPNLHILLDAPKDGNVDSRGVESEMPHSLRGISGSSIWQAYYEGLPSKTWTVDDAAIVAVQTGVYREGTIVRGTRWWTIEAILSKNYPDLEGPLSIMTPAKRISPSK